MAPQPTDQWFIDHLSGLLASPYIHFKNPTGLPLGLRLGPGPIDLFSTKFENLFAEGATGTIDGQKVDRDGLKQGLLAIQKQWNADTANFVPKQSAVPGELATSATWTPKDSQTSLEFTATATAQEEGGLPRVFTLTIQGDSSLFQ